MCIELATVIIKAIDIISPFTLYQTTKILDWSKSKAFPDDKVNVTEKLKIV